MLVTRDAPLADLRFIHGEMRFNVAAALPASPSLRVFGLELRHVRQAQRQDVLTRTLGHLVR